MLLRELEEALEVRKKLEGRAIIKKVPLMWLIIMILEGRLVVDSKVVKE
jgi:hypothetical protein